MLRQWIVCLICLWLPLVEMFGPMPPSDMKAMKPPSDMKAMEDAAWDMKDTAVESKQELDQEDVTEQQFYECFADINCELGKSVKDELFDCWYICTEEERDEYVLLFGESPVGNFTRMTLSGVNEDFCLLDDYVQRQVNDHFAAEAGKRIKEFCGSPKQKERCKRLKETAQCVMELLETNIANGKCKTIVADMENMEPMKQMGQMGGK